MSAEALTGLLEELSRGDRAAAEQAFQTYEPYLRMVVRRKLSPPLRAEFDSLDIVQSVWADLWQGFCAERWRFDNVAQLRAFLIKVTQNHFIDRARQHHRGAKHRLSLEAAQWESPPAEPSPRPSEMAEADELWCQALEACPPDHRDLLTLKRDGHSLDEIASRTGLHKSSVRRILYEVARRLKAPKRTVRGPADP